MMEAKVKRDFDLKGEVYETFRDNNDVFLTNTQIYEIFEKFWADNCSDKKKKKNPVLYIVGAQPGAGKTGFAALAGACSERGAAFADAAVCRDRLGVLLLALPAGGAYTVGADVRHGKAP